MTHAIVCARLSSCSEIQIRGLKIASLRATLGMTALTCDEWRFFLRRNFLGAVSCGASVHSSWKMKRFTTRLKSGGILERASHRYMKEADVDTTQAGSLW